MLIYCIVIFVKPENAPTQLNLNGVKMSFEMIMIGIASLVAIGILLHHPSKTLGIPSLLIFMSVGLVFGNGEFDFV